MSSFSPKDPLKVMVRRMEYLTLNEDGNQNRERHYGMYELSPEERLEKHARALKRIKQLRKIITVKQRLMEDAEKNDLPTESLLDEITSMTTKVNKEMDIVERMQSDTPTNPFSPTTNQENPSTQDENPKTPNLDSGVLFVSCLSTFTQYNPTDAPCLLFYTNTLQALCQCGEIIPHSSTTNFRAQLTAPDKATRIRMKYSMPRRKRPAASNTASSSSFVVETSSVFKEDKTLLTIQTTITANSETRQGDDATTENTQIFTASINSSLNLFR